MNAAKPKTIVALLAVSTFLLTAVTPSLAEGGEPPESKRVVDEQQRLELWSGYAEAKAQGRIVYVAGDGTGDFNCDGTDDQAEINQALQHVAATEQFTTVHLKGPATYTISETIYMPGNTILQGDADAVVTVIPHQQAQWQPWKGMIECKGNGVQNIVIRGFEIHGNRATFRSDRHYYPLYLMNAYDVTVNDMYMHTASGDGIKFQHRANTFIGTTPVEAEGRWVAISDEDLAPFNKLHEQRGRRVNSRFFNNWIEGVGHDGMFIVSVDGIEVYNNYIYGCRTNSAIRVGHCDHVLIYSNVLRNDPTTGFSGNAGVQAHYGTSPVTNVRIYGNVISRMALGGLVIYGRGGEFGTQTGVHIRNNIIYDCAIAGIRVFGLHNTLIENNVLYGNHGDGIQYYFVYHPEPSHKPGPPPDGQKYTTFVRNNIIANTLPGPEAGSRSLQGQRPTPVSGFALNNCIGVPHPDDDRPELVLEDNHQFISEHNCIWNNVSGPYNNASSDTDIYEDPLFAGPERGRFRLRPGSPCIGAGAGGQDIGLQGGAE